MTLHARARRVRPRRAPSAAPARATSPLPHRSACARCDAAARSYRAATTVADTTDADTDARLTEHRLDPQLDQRSERGDATSRGTVGRSRLSVEAGRTASALDDSSSPARMQAHAPIGAAAAAQPALQVLGPSEVSMRFMETGLALVAIAVALLLNLGR